MPSCGVDRRWPRVLGVLSLIAAALLTAPAVAADDDWTAPEPLTVPTIEYPVDATGIGRVAVRLTVRAAGDVTGIVILDASDPRFADPVSAALGGAIFVPARFRGEPREVAVEFALEVAPPPPIVLPAVLRGQVLEQGTRRPLSGAEVIMVDAVRGVATDGDGQFELEVAPGAVTIVVAAPGFVPGRFAEAVSAGEAVEVVYRLRPEARSPLEILVEAERQRAEVSRVRLSLEEVRGVPGTLDDAIRVVQTLPGVNQPSELSGALLVRGSDARDTRIYVDGIDVPFVFHFGALKSIILSDLVQDVVLYPSNFSARYGDAMGGILEVRLRDPRTDRWGGRAQLGLILSEATVEGPITDDMAVQFAFRRSYIGEVAQPFLPPQVGANFNVVPQFTDYQARMVYRRGNWTLRPFVFGSLDNAELLFDKERLIDPDNFQRFSIRNAQHNQALRATWAAGQVTGDTLVAFSLPSFRIEIGDSDYLASRDRNVIVRSDWEWRLAPVLALAGGIDTSFVNNRLEALLPRPPRPFEFDYDFLTAERVTFSQTSQINRGGVYGEARLGRSDRVSGALGLRVNFDSLTGIVTADPRGLAFLPAGKLGLFKAGAGVYHQYNAGQSAAPAPVGNPDAGPNRAIHTLIGWQRELVWDMDAGIEGFYKWIDHLVTQNPDPYGVPRWQNWGKGRAYGVELSLRKPLTDDIFGWLSYSWTRSFRRVQPDLAEEVFGSDVPHIVNAIVNWVPTANWEVGAATRVASGEPVKTVSERLYYADNNVWLPIFIDEGQRKPLYFRLDVRVKYTWLFPTWKLAWLTEVINVTNYGNVLTYNYNYDYTDRSSVSGIPILPYLALEASF